MANVKVIKRFNDMQRRVIREVGDTFECDAGRAEHLVKEGMAEIIKENKKSESYAE